MATKFQVGKNLMERIRNTQDVIVESMDVIEGLGDELQELVDLMREAVEDRSERWQESDRATETNEWIDNLDQLAATIGELVGTGKQLADDLGEVENEPEYTT